MRLVILTAAPFVLSLLLVRAATGAQTCLLRTVEVYHSAQVILQTEMHDLVAKRAPHLAGLSALNRDLQIALSERRRQQLVYLADTDPGRLITGRGVAHFMNFEWKEADQAAWLKAEPEARALEARIAKLRARSDGHQDWPALRDFYRSQLAESPEMTSAMTAFKQAGAEASAVLASCS